MGIHAIAIMASPHTGMCAMAGIAPSQAIVIAEQTRNSAAQAPKNPYREARSALVVFSMGRYRWKLVIRFVA
jgi:hypothetical protein